MVEIRRGDVYKFVASGWRLTTACTRRPLTLALMNLEVGARVMLGVGRLSGVSESSIEPKYSLTTLVNMLCLNFSPIIKSNGVGSPHGV